MFGQRRLKHLGCARIAAEIKDVGIDEIKKHFKDYTPLTPEEVKEMKLANEWAWRYEDEDVVAEGFDDDTGNAPADDSSGAGGGEEPRTGAGAGAGAGAGPV